MLQPASTSQEKPLEPASPLPREADGALELSIVMPCLDEERTVVGCVERGVYFHGYTKQGPPGHAGFSLAHTNADFADTLEVADSVCADLRREGAPKADLS